MRYVRSTDRSFWDWHRLPSLPPLPHSCTVTVGGPCAYMPGSTPARPAFPPLGRILWPPLVTGMTFYIYACDFDCHMLGSDGTVSFWDKDARTRMKSKPSLLILGSTFLAMFLASLGRVFSVPIHPSLVTHSFRSSPHSSPIS